MKNKKAVELTLNVIVVAAIVLVVLAVSIMIYTGVIGKERNQLNQHIFSIGHDCDGDGLSDAIDPCPCDPNVQDESKCPTPLKDCADKITKKECITDAKSK